MKHLKQYTIIGIFFVLITGTLAHFLYDWTGNNYIVGPFTPINESIWEHMKLLFFPMLIYSLIMILKFHEKYSCITSTLGFGILAGALLIPFFIMPIILSLGRMFLFWISVHLFWVLLLPFGSLTNSHYLAAWNLSHLYYAFWYIFFLFVCWYSPITLQKLLFFKIQQSQKLDKTDFSLILHFLTFITLSFLLFLFFLYINFILVLELVFDFLLIIVNITVRQSRQSD